MTGTGTLDDPYVVHSWSEYISKCNEYGKYITCPENSVWDMNEQLPNGLTETINANYKFFDGNGLIIKNIYLNGGTIRHTSDAIFSRVTFENIATSANNNSLLSFLFSGAAYGEFNIKNCDFKSVVLTSGSLFGISNTQPWYHHSIILTNDGERSCLLDVTLLNNSKIFNDTANYNDLYLYNCMINLNGDTSEIENYIYFYRCYFTGSYPYQSTFSDTVSVIDSILELETNSKYNDNALRADSSSVYNKDLNPKTSSMNQAKGVTTQQLKDANYLQSIGFSIATE